MERERKKKDVCSESLCKAGSIFLGGVVVVLLLNTSAEVQSYS